MSGLTYWATSGPSVGPPSSPPPLPPLPVLDPAPPLDPLPPLDVLPSEELPLDEPTPLDVPPLLDAFEPDPLEDEQAGQLSVAPEPHAPIARENQTMAIGLARLVRDTPT